MSNQDDQVRERIAEQASDWFVTNDEAPLGTAEAAELVDWLKASPLNVEEFLGVAGIARDLHNVCDDPEFSTAALLARARADEQHPVRALWPRAFASVRQASLPRWRAAGIVMAAIATASVGLLMLWNSRSREGPPARVAALQLQTRHGEFRTYRLADNSVLHLNTDTSVTVRYGPTQRLVVVNSGEVDFEVTHEPKREFRVRAGMAEIADLGTNFDVHVRPEATVVTVVEGRVAVEPSRAPGAGDTEGARNRPQQSVVVGANQQISVAAGEWPVAPIGVDAQRATSWLHRQIAFEHERLERVAAEFNRYAAKPIEITSPKLRELEVSGVFSTDDPEEFLAFLRSLEGVQVEVTATRIRVSQK